MYKNLKTPAVECWKLFQSKQHFFKIDHQKSPKQTFDHNLQ